MLVFCTLLLFSVSLSMGLPYAASTCLHKANSFHVDALDTLNAEPTQLYLFCDGFSNIGASAVFFGSNPCLFFIHDWCFVASCRFSSCSGILRFLTVWSKLWGCNDFDLLFLCQFLQIKVRQWSEFVSSFDGVRKDSRIRRVAVLLGLLMKLKTLKISPIINWWPQNRVFSFFACLSFITNCA